MSWSYPIGRFFGSEVRVHATFFLLLLWIGVAAYTTQGAMAAVFTATALKEKMTTQEPP